MMPPKLPSFRLAMPKEQGTETREQQDDPPITMKAVRQPLG